MSYGNFSVIIEINLKLITFFNLNLFLFSLNNFSLIQKNRKHSINSKNFTLNF